MSITQLKVFGERNTGTNWVEAILTKNYNVPLIHHSGIIRNKTTQEQKEFLDLQDKNQKKFIREKLTDAIFENQAAHLFGWKHSCVVYNDLKYLPGFNETGFIFLVKNPYSFIKSLHKRPYHALSEVPKDIDAFISSPWLTVHRDAIKETLLNTPIELWNYKVYSYIKFMENASNSLLLSYEEVLNNPEILFNTIESKFSIIAKSRLAVTQSTKSDILQTDDYKDKYLTNNPMSGLSSSSIDLIREVIDQNLAKVCQYDI